MRPSGSYLARCARADSTINRYGMRKVVDPAKQMNRPKPK